MKAPGSGHRGCRVRIQPSCPLDLDAGFSLIEALVTLVILSVGLLGLAGLQAKLQLSEIDAYQRAQALLLLQDMADRIASNRRQAAAYVTGIDHPLGTGHEPAADCGALETTAAQDACEWSTTLQGAAETVTVEGATLPTGAMVGARGCVEAVAGATYMITVVWQGLTPLAAPGAGLRCGRGRYDSAVDGAPCVNDLCRRAASTVVRIGTMD